jgi:ABC transporter with metal-binding/Fe-S-binding domain ATP-binding protein
MRVAVLYSGGKDSTRAVELALEQGHEVVTLLTALSRNLESYMFHVPGVKLVSLHDLAMGIRAIYFRTPGMKEKEVEDLKKALEHLTRGSEPIEGVVCGAIRSNYQRDRVARVCSELGLECLTPLWGVDPEKHMKDLVARGYEIMIIGVAAEGLDESWLGRMIDEKCLMDLTKLSEKYGVGLDGEGGEFETLVCYAPFFKMRIIVQDFSKIWKGNSGYIEIKKADLEPV